jgi:hypothetical protein
MPALQARGGRLRLDTHCNTASAAQAASGSAGSINLLFYTTAVHF